MKDVLIPTANKPTQQYTIVIEFQSVVNQSSIFLYGMLRHQAEEELCRRSREEPGGRTV
jgi:hypothetical protein